MLVIMTLNTISVAVHGAEKSENVTGTTIKFEVFMKKVLPSTTLPSTGDIVDM